MGTERPWQLFQRVHHETQASPHLPAWSTIFEKMCLHPGVEREAGYVVNFHMVPNLPDGNYADLTWLRSTVYFSLYPHHLNFFHFGEAGSWPQNHTSSCVSNLQHLMSSNHQCFLFQTEDGDPRARSSHPKP